MIDAPRQFANGASALGPCSHMALGQFGIKVTDSEIKATLDQAYRQVTTE